MESVRQALAQMAVGKAQTKFMVILFNSLLVVRGKVNFVNLSRYSHYCEKTLRRWFSKPFDFEAFNLLCLSQVIAPERLLLFAIDASFLPKSGKKTYGLDWFWNGCLGRAEKGLEISLIALIDLKAHSAYALSAKQTPARAATNFSRLELYLQHLQEARSYLPDGVTCGVCDSYYAKKLFVDGVCAMKLHLISKLRIDANMRFLYTGPQKPRGRRRHYGDKVRLDDLNGYEDAGVLEHEVHLYTALVQHASLKRVIRIVLLLNLSNPEKPRQALLFSTDTELTAQEIVKRYSARFQIEFLIRDAKQFTGLSDCQARNQAALHFHVNASLAAVNLAKLKVNQDCREESVFSLASLKHRAFNTHLLDMIIERFELEPTSIKLHPSYPDLCNYGSLAA
jgi:hypothetical protein